MSDIISVPQSTRKDSGCSLLSRLVMEDMHEVNTLILEKITSHVRLIPEIGAHLITSGGKRIRPMLTIASARLCGYTGKKHILFAAAIEFMHTATLLHDDVVDESDVRRGKETARILWGNQASILVGDYLLGQAFRLMTQSHSVDALTVLANTAVSMAEGEVWQLATTKDISTTPSQYLAIIEAKTASLFSAAMEVGAIIAGADPTLSRALHSFGTNIGIAFQLTDDILDYAGRSEELGKSIGDDFREGKVTLPVILSYSRSNNIERAFWDRVLRSDHICDTDLQKAIDILNTHRALEDTILQAKKYAETAYQTMNSLPDNDYKQAFLEMARSSIDRQF